MGRVALFYTLAVKRAESSPRSPGVLSPGLYFWRPPTVQDSVVIRQSRPGTIFHKRSGRKLTTKAMVAEMPKKLGGAPPMPGGGMDGMGGMDYPQLEFSLSMRVGGEQF